jgi:hypothetical protein
MLCLLLKRLELCGHTKDYSCVGGFYTRLSVSVVGKDMAGGDAVLSLDCADGSGWGAGRNASPFPVMEGDEGRTGWGGADSAVRNKKRREGLPSAVWVILLV